MRRLNRPYYGAGIDSCVQSQDQTTGLIRKVAEGIMGEDLLEGLLQHGTADLGSTSIPAEVSCFPITRLEAELGQIPSKSVMRRSHESSLITTVPSRSC